MYHYRKYKYISVAGSSRLSSPAKFVDVAPSQYKNLRRILSRPDSPTILGCENVEKTFKHISAKYFFGQNP